MNKKSGIYAIINVINGKKYIGQSSNLEKRKAIHFCSLDGNYHANRHLQNSYNKYGKENFEFKILEYCECKKDTLTSREQFFVDLHSPDMLYNIRTECVDSNLGTHHSEKAKRKISAGNKGKLVSLETRKKISNKMSGKNSHMYGKKRSEETKRKISKAHTGKVLSEAQKKKISDNMPDMSGKNNPFYGEHHSKKTKELLSKKMTGRRHTKETRKKMSASHLGKHHSQETSDKISRANCGRIFSEDHKRMLSENHADFLGEKNGNSKLTKVRVFEILDLYYNKNEKVVSIAKKYGVNRSTIYSVCHGKTWKHVYEEFMDKN